MSCCVSGGPALVLVPGSVTTAAVPYIVPCTSVTRFNGLERLWILSRPAETNQEGNTHQRLTRD